ncbi:MAG TPA: S8 family serine peptidase, partial [Dehalococcoidia bacterium]|nr:S8 family serine peptidase [Dehalococcoidia bacterium]
EEARRTPARRYVLNLSLGIAVILSAIQSYIDDPSLAFSDPGAWQSLVEGLGVLRNSPTRQADFRRKNDQLVSDGLARLAIDPQDGDEYLTFTGMLGKFEYLFSGKTLPRNVLVVAASGNDSCAETLFEPRLPAAIEGVLGVSAVDVAGKQTPYANLGDMVDVDEGIGAFGGPVNPGTLDCANGLEGLFIGAFPPDNAAAGAAAAVANQYGTAMWSGTSFATPIVAAVAACIWSVRRRVTGQQLIDQISLIGGRRARRRRLRDFIKDPQTGSPLKR